MKLSSRHHVLFYALAVLALSLALAVPAPARAEETVPPTEIPAEPPAADLTGTVALLNETGSVLTDETGQPVPLASQEAVEILTDPDPYIVRGGTTYAFTAADCDPLVGGLQPCANPVQAAINFALPGETVNIEPGTYTEQLMIAKDLTLQGTAPGVVIQSPAVLANCFTTSAENRSIVCVTGANNVSVNNLTIDGLGLGNANYRFQGIGYYNAGGVIDGNTVLNIEDTPFSGMQAGVGIYAYNLDGTPRSLTITDNLVDDFQKTGIAANGAGLTVLIDGNTVVGFGPTDITAQNGIQVGYGATGTVSNNTISGVDYTPATWTATGILLYDPGDGVVVTGNDVQDAQNGIYAYYADGVDINNNSVDGSSWGIYADSSDGVSITDNLVTDSDGDGIDLYDVNGADISGNTVDNSSYDGIWIGGSSTAIQITGNVITDNGNGVSDPAAGGIHITGATDSESLVITGNTFSGNRNGVSNSLVETPVEAYGNYWGCPGGPDDTDCDPVYEWVLYDPYLSIDPTLPVNAPAPAPRQAPYRIVPVTGGQLFDIPCDAPVALVNFMGMHQIEFKGLCGYSAVIDESPLESLPESLLAGEIYAAGLSITLFLNGAVVDVTPTGASIVVMYKMPQADTSYSILYWDDQANNNLGAWYTLPPKQADVTQPLALYPDNPADPRLVIIGAWTRPNSTYLEVELNFGGTFLLVTP